MLFQESKVKRAHGRARDILKFSPLVTDAYFHYTPSQIMLAALWIADESLFEHFIEATFAVAADPRNNALVVKDKTVAAVRACKQMLLHEPPERMSEFWGTVSKTPSFRHALFRKANVERKQPESMNLIKPLMKKLRKCRDPDRFDLIALHKKRLEFREKETMNKSNTMEEDGAVFGGEKNANADRESKRRKVALQQDPFGPALGA